MVLNPIFIQNIQTVYGDEGQLWLQQLPIQLKSLEQRWDFHFIKPLADLTFNFVGLVAFNANQKPAVIKIAPRSEHLLRELHCLLWFKKAGPKIYAYDEEQYVFLMQYLNPGYSLKMLVKGGEDDTATRIICHTILELQKVKQQNYPLKHLTELVADLSSLQGHIDAKILNKAQSLFTELTQDRSQDVLLHGDLHHDNIIRHESSWKVIDPHGYIGDPAAEVGVMIRNPMDCFPQDKPLATIIDTRINILKEELPFDPQKIKAWAFVMTILSAAWNMQDFNYLAKEEIELAKLIDKVKF
jgi:streptomycin 6-kinase